MANQSANIPGTIDEACCIAVADVAEVDANQSAVSDISASNAARGVAFSNAAGRITTDAGVIFVVPY